jgi:hypothetical protein
LIEETVKDGSALGEAHMVVAREAGAGDGAVQVLTFSARHPMGVEPVQAAVDGWLGVGMGG